MATVDAIISRKPEFMDYFKFLTKISEMILALK
jgi:hypothetical protein